MLQSRADHKKTKVYPTEIGQAKTLRRSDALLPPTLMLLLTGALFASPPTFLSATTAGMVPGTSSIAIQQHLVQPVVVAYDPNGNLYYGTYHIKSGA